MAAMTYEEMERALAEATLSSFAHTPVVKSVTVPAVKSHDAMLIEFGGFPGCRTSHHRAGKADRGAASASAYSWSPHKVK